MTILKAACTNGVCLANTPGLDSPVVLEPYGRSLMCHIVGCDANSSQAAERETSDETLIAIILGRYGDHKERDRVQQGIGAEGGDLVKTALEA